MCFRLNPFLLLFALLIFCVSLIGPAWAETVVVTNTDDSGGASLRNVIEEGVGDGDVIDLTGLTGTITLTSNSLFLNHDVTIRGPGADKLRIIGSWSGDPGPSPLFIVGGETSVVIEGLTLGPNEGDTAGAVVNNGALTLRYCHIKSNRGNSGPGGILNNALLSVVRCTFFESYSFSNNHGGAIHNLGSASIHCSTFYNNLTTMGYGCAMATASGDLTLTDSTIGQNTPYSSFGGVLVLGGTFTCSGSVLSGYSPNFRLNGGAAVSNGYNYIQGSAAGVFTATGDQASSRDPMLGSFAYNGGIIPTLLPKDGSPLIDAGDPNSTEIRDQRLVRRPQDGDGDGSVVIDIGAVEVLTQNGPPVADAGEDRTVYDLSSTTLDGSGSSDPNGDVINYLWTQTDGRGGTPDPDDLVNLLKADTARPVFPTPEVDLMGKVLYFDLVVSDPDGLSDLDSLEITVRQTNLPPKADAGPYQTVQPQDTVFLDGSETSDYRDMIRYEWNQIRCYQGAPAPAAVVNINNAYSHTADFTAPGIKEALCFGLTVTDTVGQVGYDTTIVNVSEPNEPPVVSLGGDSEVDHDTTATLKASGSDPEGGPLTYRWYEKSDGSYTLLSKVTGTTYTTVSSGEFKVEVEDFQGLSASDTHTVKYVPAAGRVTTLLMIGVCLVLGLRVFRRRSGAGAALVLILAAALVCDPAAAQEQAVVFCPDNPHEWFLVDFNDPAELFNSLDETTLHNNLPSYRGTEDALTGKWQAPGATVAVNVAEGSDTAFIDIPELGVHEVFSTDSPAATMALVRTWFQANGDQTVARIKELVEANQDPEEETPEEEAESGGTTKNTLFSGCFIGALLD